MPEFLFLINGKALAVTKRLRSENLCSIFCSLIFSHRVCHHLLCILTLTYPLNSSSLVYLPCQCGSALILSHLDYCNSHLHLAFSLLVQVPSATRVSIPKGSIHWPAFQIPLPPVFSWYILNPEHTLCFHTCLLYSSCNFLTLERDPQNSHFYYSLVKVIFLLQKSDLIPQLLL